MPLTVKGMPELQRALRRTSSDVRRGVQKAQRDVAEPVRAEAERLATSIGNVGSGWERMRTGLTSCSIYVAPRKRGRRGVDKRKRPKFAAVLMDRALQPALDMHDADIERRYEQMLDDVADRFNRGY